MLINKIGDLVALPAGYMVWRQEDLWHVRWWSDQRKTFSGEITGLPTLKKLKKLRMSKEDLTTFSQKKLIFRGVSDKGRIKGFDITAKPGSSLTFLLAIEGTKNVADKVIVATREGHPDRMPFSLD